MQRDLEVCHEITSDSMYKRHVDTILAAWYKFVPHSPSKEMLSSNCWYTSTFKDVSHETIKKLQVNNFYNIPQQFPQSKLNQEVLNMLNSAVKFDTPAVKGNQSRDSEVFCLPSVYMVGFPKCGTTTLYDQLTSHSDVAKSSKKEGQFWGNFVVAPNKFYHDLEALLYTYRFKAPAKKISQSTYLKVTMDASTHTVYDGARLGDAAKDMCMIPFLLHKVMPNTKIIVMLRDPTKRLWSHYWFYCSKKKYNFEMNHKSRLSPVPEDVVENASERFHNHTLAAMNEFNDCIQSGESEFKCTYDAFFDDDNHSLACGKTRIGVSLYYFHIIKWLSVFPKEQFLFLRMEDLAEDSYSVASSAWEFMGLDPLPRSKYRPIVSNTNNWITSSTYKDSFKMWPETKELLDTFFRPYNERLAKLMNFYGRTSSLAGS